MSSPSGDAVFKITAEMIEAATKFTDILSGDPEPDEAIGVFRRLSRVLHPDYHHGKPTEARAAAAFAKLATLWGKHQGNGVAATLSITTRKRTYAVSRLPEWQGDVANFYRCVHMDGDDEVVSWLKMVRSPKDGELVQREALVLRRLQADGHEDFRWGAPEIVESFRHRDNAAHVDRWCLVREAEPGLVTLADVQSAYPAGLDPRDAAWIWRRLLALAGWAHHAGIIHGAILPEHVVIHPTRHRVMLVGWGRSVEIGGTITSIPKGSRAMYPPEVLDKKPADEATDVYMLSKCMEALLGDQAPVPFKAFIRGCTFVRAKDAWALQDEYTELIERLYGARKYRPLSMPTPVSR